MHVAFECELKIEKESLKKFINYLKKKNIEIINENQIDYMILQFKQGNEYYKYFELTDNNYEEYDLDNIECDLLDEDELGLLKLCNYLDDELEDGEHKNINLDYIELDNIGNAKIECFDSYGEYD